MDGVSGMTDMTSMLTSWQTGTTEGFIDPNRVSLENIEARCTNKGSPKRKTNPKRHAGNPKRG